MILFETLKNWAARCNNRQNNTTNTTVYDQRMCMGWSFVTGDGSSYRLSKTITFPFTFDSTPIVFVATLGARPDSNPINIEDFSTTNRATCVSVETITTTGFTVWVVRRSIDGTDPTPLTNGMRYGFSWIAIGTSKV